MKGPWQPTPWLLDVSDGQGQHCGKTNHREGQAGNFKRLFAGQLRLLFQLFLHLWTMAMNQEQTQGQMERGTYRKPCRTKALQMTSRWPAQESLQPGVALQVTAAANQLAFRFGERSFGS